MAVLITQYFNNETHSDVTIFIYDFKLPAHSVILCLQSIYFDKILNSGMKKSQTKENEAPAPIAGEDDPGLKKHLRVYIFADMLLNDDLEEFAFQRFSEELPKS
ncbi:hypothetical protein BO70DRAFT_425860 [Aspergillus heteromorphus CBS 117.55]|uniref:BTB domain-containing protein n=1 Tax=Aspergillus heteromorphus CBS 117.55 TaxID=1448321 RepID=A0A317WX58_9EURO|nr:uncharacterized protein BO70DRAFT_425860 [Aspergillus heteromorphus CBS 117.55]PWY90933.1 hypothetical protein BO70DRAFT_425860 [Aspergillus heteromorphus CBS 117.55]